MYKNKNKINNEFLEICNNEIIELDIECGPDKNTGYVGIDKR